MRELRRILRLLKRNVHTLSVSTHTVNRGPKDVRALGPVLHKGGVPQVEVTRSGSPHLSCKHDQIKMKDYIHVDRRDNSPKRVTLPTWSPPPLCKQALSCIIMVKRVFLWVILRCGYWNVLFPTCEYELGCFVLNLLYNLSQRSLVVPIRAIDKKVTSDLK